jgi:hypothetical protein
MAVREACFAMLAFAESHFRQIEGSVPPPQWVPWDGKFNWRYQEKLPTQILVQKMARQITGLKAADELLLKGLLQELGVMFRVLDELEEDISFLSLALANGTWYKLHDSYAEYFWSEDDDDRQPPVQRKKIRAFVNRVFDMPDPSSADAVGRTIHRAFSDYVHARSAPTMGMVSGPPARFHLDGITDISAKHNYVEQMPSYFYRAAASIVLIAKVALGDQENDECYEQFRSLEQQYSEIIFPNGRR